MPDFAPHIEQVPLASLVPYPNNPKLHPEGQIDLVAGSIREFGFLVPLVIDVNGSIIAGHGRYHAAKKLGLESVPAIRAEHLTKAQIKAFRLADNKVAESGWDAPSLALELEELTDLDFDISIAGFGETQTTGQPSDGDSIPDETVTITVRITAENWVTARERVIPHLKEWERKYHAMLQVDE